MNRTYHSRNKGLLEVTPIVPLTSKQRFKTNILIYLHLFHKSILHFLTKTPFFLIFNRLNHRFIFKL